MPSRNAIKISAHASPGAAPTNARALTYGGATALTYGDPIPDGTVGTADWHARHWPLVGSTPARPAGEARPARPRLAAVLRVVLVGVAVLLAI